MAEELSNSGGNQAKREELIGFANWPVWSGITESMLIKKDIWDLISTGPRPPRKNPGLWTKEIKEDHMAVGIAQKIIRKGVAIRLPSISWTSRTPKRCGINSRVSAPRSARE